MSRNIFPAIVAIAAMAMLLLPLLPAQDDYIPARQNGGIAVLVSSIGNDYSLEGLAEFVRTAAKALDLNPASITSAIGRMKQPSS